MMWWVWGVNGAAIDDDVRALEEVGEAVQAPDVDAVGGVGQRLDVDGKDVHLEAERTPGDLLADLAVADDADGPAGDLQDVGDGGIARPAAGGLVLLEAVEAARERQQHGEGVLGDDAGVGAARVGDGDIALDDLGDRAEHLDAGARSLDPLEALRGLELLQGGPAVDDVGVHDLAGDLVWGGGPDLLDVRQVVEQAEVRIAHAGGQQQLHG